jgi:alkylhydroperoxidase family enzyme
MLRKRPQEPTTPCWAWKRIFGSPLAYEEVSKRFTEEELVNLTLAIVTINGWNRLAIGFRAVPGDYQPAAHKVAEGGKQ